MKEKIYNLINLQLFAETANMMATTDAGLTAEMKEFYDTELLAQAQPNLVYQQMGKKVAMPQHTGKVVEWRRWSDLEKATNPLTEGVTPDGHKFTVSTIKAETYQYGDYTIITDVIDLTAVDNVVLEVTERQGANAGRTIDTVTRDAVMLGKRVYYAPKADGTKVELRSDLDDTCLLTPIVVARASTILKKENTPLIDGDYVAIIHPSVEFDLITHPDWIDVHKYADAESVYEGEIGKLYNVRFLVSTEAKIWNSAADDTPDGLAVYGCIFFGKDAYGVVDLEGGGLEMIIKQTTDGGVENALNQRGSIGWKVTGYAAKILMEEYICRVECCSSFSAEDVAN